MASLKFGPLLVLTLKHTQVSCDKSFLLPKAAIYTALQLPMFAGSSTEVTSLKSVNEIEVPGLIPSERKKNRDRLILNYISKLQSPSDIFSEYKENKANIEEMHVFQMVAQLAKFISSSTAKTSDIVTDPEFQNMCYQIWKWCRMAKLHDVISLLKYFTRLEVSANSLLIQSLLQMVRHQVNQLTINQIYILQFVLKKMKPTPLSDALLKALPMVLETRHLRELKILPLQVLNSVLSNCLIHHLSITNDVIYELHRKRKEINEDLAYQVLINMLSVNHMKLMKDEAGFITDIIDVCLQKISVYLGSYSSEQISRLLDMLAFSQSRKRYVSVNLEFWIAISEFIAKSDYNVEVLGNIIANLWKVNFISDSLVHQLFGKLSDNLNEVKSVAHLHAPILSALSSCIDMPFNYQNAVNHLLHEVIHMQKESVHLDPRAAVSLLAASFNFSPEILDNLCKSEVIKRWLQLIGSKLKWPYITLLQLNEAISHFTAVNCQIPNEYLLLGMQYLQSYSYSPSFLEPCLKSIVHDESSIISGVYTRAFVYLNHLLIVDEEGNLVPCSTYSSLEKNNAISELRIPDSSKKVGILSIASSMILWPDMRVKSQITLQKKLLEAEGISVIQVLEPYFLKLKAEEQRVYLIMQLKEKGIKIRNIRMP